MAESDATPTPEESRGASASGERAVAVGGSVSQSVIITGDNSTLNLAAGVVEGPSSEEVLDLHSYWNSVRALAEFPLSPSVFTASREEDRTRVREWLAKPPSSLFMKTYGLNDGIDFLAALGESEKDERLQGGLIVYTIQAWRRFSASHEPRVLIANPALEITASDSSGAVASGHHVFVSGPRGVAAQGAGVVLRRQEHLAISEALQGCGFPERRARALGRACCGSSSILKRLITLHPETRFPTWCHDDDRSSVAPFALVGGWIHVDPSEERATPQIGAPPPLDTWVVTELLGCTRDELDRLVARWQRAIEPLFLRFGTSVLVASREDAWHLLGGAITKEQLQRFRDLAHLVLEEDNPAFQLEPEQRWLANLYGKVPSLSEELRRSIVETLALMTTYPTAEVDPNIDFAGTVRWILERALPRHATWQRWASFGRNLKVVAEADPEFFLARVECDLNSQSPELTKLFQDQLNNLFAGAIHSDLLWSLEGLAWNPQYLSRVAVALARLAAHDPGGTYANRPSNSLIEIFLPWLWHTNASANERLQALGCVLRAEPEVGWKLLMGLLPGRRPTMSTGTHQPRWRPWADGWSRANLRSQLTEYAFAVTNLTMSAAGLDPRRWADVFDGILHASSESAVGVFAALDAIAEASARDDDAVFPLWAKLREVVARHEEHASESWAFPAGIRDRLAEMRDRLAPSNPVLLYQHLFDDGLVDLPGIDPGENFEVYSAALRDVRLAALRQIVSSFGSAGVIRLLNLSKAAHVVGWLVGQERLLSVEEIGLPAVFEITDAQRLTFVCSYLSCRHHREGWDFVDAIPTAGWSSLQLASLALCLPFGGETWQRLRRFGPEVRREYWTRVRGYLRRSDLEQVRVACQSLIEVGRPFAAVEVVHSATRDGTGIPSDLIADVLEATLTTPSTEEARDIGSVRYDIQQLVKFLQQDTSFDLTRLALIEWGMLPVLDRETSQVTASTMISMTESHPEFFVTLLTTVYRAENASAADAVSSEQDQIRARYAREFLNSLVCLPGTNDEGVVDYDYFRSWTIEARTRAAACDRLAACDHNIGEIIARASFPPDENWPSPETAKLIEEIGSEAMLEGFQIGFLKGRRVAEWSVWEGGEQKRLVAARCRDLAEHARSSSLKLAEAFLNLAKHYDDSARDEDEDAERRRLGR